jgi:broad specificity phosphatase PhoE
VLKRVGEFWEQQILPLRLANPIVLIITHGGIIGRLREYLNSRNCQLNQSGTEGKEEWRKEEVRNCSISEILVDGEGRWKILRAGDYDHLKNDDSLNSLISRKLENSTGED